MRAKLALRNIEDNLCFTDDEAWAWFVLPTQPWAFRSDSQREQLLFGSADALAWLAGHRVHLRVTTRPYPAADWARQLDENTPSPLRSSTGDRWGDHLVAMQEHLRHQTMAEKEVFLGVRLSHRPRATSSLRRSGAGRGTWSAHGSCRWSNGSPRPSGSLDSTGAPPRPPRWSGCSGGPWGSGSPPPPRSLLRRAGSGSPTTCTRFTDEVDYAAVPLGRTVQVTGRSASPVERHVAVMSVGRLEEIEAPDPGHEPWLAHTDRLPFPVEWTAQFDILSGGEARQAIQRKLLVVRDMQRHYREHDLDEPLALDRQARQARQVEDQMSRGVDVAAARLHGWFRLAVSGQDRGRVPREGAQGDRVVPRPTGDDRAPQGPVRAAPRVHPRRAGVDLGVPASAAGAVLRRRRPDRLEPGRRPAWSVRRLHRRGRPVARSCSTPTTPPRSRRPPACVPVVGGLGAGKSVLLGQITYDAVRRGIPSVVLDPSGPLARLTELPELREHSEHIDLTTAHSGTLNPFEVVARPQPPRLPHRRRASTRPRSSQPRTASCSRWTW